MKAGRATLRSLIGKRWVDLMRSLDFLISERSLQLEAAQWVDVVHGFFLGPLGLHRLVDPKPGKSCIS